MTDVFTKEKRSEIMSAIRGKGNDSTEERFKELLVLAKLKGWRENASDVFGKPDFVFDRKKIAVFIDGCFWHGCNECRNIPEANRDFWEKKIGNTKIRDELVNKSLSSSGWTVLRFWEHELKKKNVESTLKKIRTLIGPRRLKL